MVFFDPIVLKLKTMKKSKEKIIFIIKDGWGYRKEKRLNAIASAKTPNTDFFEKEYPSAIIKASGEEVGLPKGYQGNSEVGHLTIGSGRIIKQNLVKINDSIKKGDFFKKKELKEAIRNCKKNNTKLHIIGLLQEEGVHSHIKHLYALLDFCKQEKFKDVYLHVITDGRDSPIHKGKFYLKNLDEKMKKIGIGEIVTISGRYYAMDRDKRWDRTKKAYNAIVEGKTNKKFSNIFSKIRECYDKGETDEFIIPSAKKDYKGISNKDSVIFFNFRIDRPRQLTKAIIEKEFEGWKRKYIDVFFVAMTDYYFPMSGKSIFKEEELKNLLGEIFSKKGLSQLRISETEKYAHVTFFFNGQKEKAFKNEDRILIPSLKVKTYDLAPKMKAKKITEKTVEKIKENKYNFILVNLVNADMVGHSGKKKPIIEAVEEVDACVGKIVREALSKNYCTFIFSDHGNAEDQSLKWRTSHTVWPVKINIVSENLKNRKLKKGKGLKDIAPTALDVIKIKKPKEMEGESILI